MQVKQAKLPENLKFCSINNKLNIYKRNKVSSGFALYLNVPLPEFHM